VGVIFLPALWVVQGSGTVADVMGVGYFGLQGSGGGQKGLAAQSLNHVGKWKRDAHSREK